MDILSDSDSEQLSCTAYCIYTMGGVKIKCASLRDGCIYIFSTSGQNVSQTSLQVVLTIRFQSVQITCTLHAHTVLTKAQLLKSPVLGYHGYADPLIYSSHNQCDVNVSIYMHICMSLFSVCTLRGISIQHINIFFIKQITNAAIHMTFTPDIDINSIKLE